jgi:hypothetical protein
MKRQLLLIVVTMALAGCGSSGLPYKPDHPSGVPISADFSLLLDRLRIEIETGGYRLEDAQILKTDGTGVSPQHIEHPAPRGGSGIGIGIGVGGGSTGGRGGVGVGTGIGVGTTIGEGRAEGNTVAFFSLDQVGPAPWRLRVKLVGIEPAVIVLGGASGPARPTGRRE